MKKYQLSTINCQLKNLPKYESYKDSGFEWLGQIPKNWQTLKMKYMFRDFSEKGKPEAELLSVTQSQGVVPRTWVDTRMVMPSGNLESFKLIKKGDFAISLRSFEGGLEYCYHDGIISPAYTVLKHSRNDLIAAYYKYLFKSHTFISELQTSVVGIREGKNISYSGLSESHMPIPSKEEQQAIAKFLDEKTGQIDQAIEIKEQQIALLKERKQIIIQNAVTKGLNPHAPMKDSGVDWIGDIPSHWDVKRLKFIGNAIIGLTYDPSNLCDEENGTLVLRASNLKDGEFVYGDKLNAYVNVKVSDKLTIKKDDILICSRNGSRDLIGKCAIAAEHDAGVTFGAFTTVFRSEINPYLIQILNSEIFRFLSGSFLTSTINQLTIGNLNSISVPLPPEKEQQQIRKSLEEERGLIDTAISAQQAQIDKLKEYKASLINSAVTGKIKIN